MFLIEYEKNTFVDGEKIDWVESENDVVSFTVTCDTKTIYTVTNDCKPLFLNHLQALNSNITNVEKSLGNNNKP